MEENNLALPFQKVEENNLALPVKASAYGLEKVDEQSIIVCPHCNDYIIMIKLNCAIFRHGVLKSNLKQIDPHSNKDLCDYYTKNNLIFGCGKPFRVIEKNNVFETEICDYI